MIVCKSVHHGNTRLVAERFAETLQTSVSDPDAAELPKSKDAWMIGIGSGIYYGRFHKSIREWVMRLPVSSGRQHLVFLFSTSGLPFLSAFYHYPLRRSLRRKGYEVVAEFSCRGHDTFGPLWFFGGLNRKHPDARDLKRAAAFADQQLHSASDPCPRADVREVDSNVSCG
jgi:flavodoxin